ncbi:MAG: DsbA family oxidoreductase [Rhodospirillales bacterium]|nr:DsbA family oxidoreductase [Rhodospirillales bacterium]
MIFDPSCPWCYIGLRQMRHALTLRPTVTADVKLWPFMLNPDVPTAGLDRNSYLCHKYGSSTRLQRMEEAVEAIGETVGLRFNFRAIDFTPNTLYAHRFIQLASSQKKGEQALELVFAAYFLRGMDIGDPALLESLGRQLGFAPHAIRNLLTSGVEREWVLFANQRAQRLGISGVPTFVFDRRLIICGAQEAATLARMIDAASHMGNIVGQFAGQA